MIEAQVRDLAPHPNDKLPADAQRMRPSSISHPSAGEEMAALLAERTTTRHALGDMPLVVLSGAGTEREAQNPAGEEKRKSNQASLVALSPVGKQSSRRAAAAIRSTSPNS
jgi:hypothetical protein